MSVVKRPRVESAGSGSLIAGGGVDGRTEQITSSLSSPNVQLSGHEAEVLAVQFDATGSFIASGSADKSILLWNSAGENENYGVINGHKGAVLDIRWSRDSSQLFSCSTDLSLGVWDVESGSRLLKQVGHDDIINSIDIIKRGTELVISGSDDGTIGIWDPRQKESVSYIQTEFPILAVAATSVGDQVFSAGVEGTIHSWDYRYPSAPVYTLPGHGETNITGLAVSPDDQQLVSNGMDNTVRTWNVRSFTSDNRTLQVYDGAPHGIEQNLLRARWSPDGSRIAAGSADRTVVIWDVPSRRILYKLPGHIGSVNDVCFSPTEPVIASASSDRSVILGEVN
ncbi:guanine nucleotide-binding protein subunit beta [Sugiyamaella lignohabitans]|uniref:Guanine nucleotide-binding protein subunit beta n=1 Tax=Sugiyamaella lignohabitans TaxID=796027 RepID=A0A167CD32_9ASCO|nr:guanine nucleotide-binding protein subunit beta [Sugiyamaella lignohabitans]ANB11530.1 guanine nucleotide-binding protein subunit beta [Sugiyamaella lignohabitans]